MAGPLFAHRAAGPTVATETAADPSMGQPVPGALHESMFDEWNIYRQRIWDHFGGRPTLRDWYRWLLTDAGRPPGRFAPPIEWFADWAVEDSDRWHRMFAPWVGRDIDPYGDVARVEFDRARRAAANRRAQAEAEALDRWSRMGE